MPRTIINSTRDFKMDDQVDNYIQRLFKYIPGEIVALYVGVIPFLKDATQTVEYVIAGALMVLTYLYLWLVQKVKTQRQIILSTICFVAWVFALGGPFKFYTWYNDYPFLPLLVLGGFTLFLPIKPKPDA